MNFSASLKHHAFGRQSWIRVFCFHPQKTFDTGFRSHSINIHISHWLKPSTRKKEKPVWRWKTRENMSNSPSENGFFCADCWRLMFVGRDISYQKCRSLCCLYSKLPVHINHCLDFSFVSLRSLTCLEKTCFQQTGSSTVESTSQAALGSSDQWKVPASLSLFLQLEKIPALFDVGKGLSIGPSVIWDLCLRPVLRPFSYAKKNSKVNHELATTRE